MVGRVTCPLCNQEYIIDINKAAEDATAHLMCNHPVEYKELKNALNKLYRLVRHHLNGKVSAFLITVDGVKY